MKDFREMNFCENDLETADRKIRNGGYSPDELCDIFSNKELAAMWHFIENKYDYSLVEEDPEANIIKFYIREKLLIGIENDDYMNDSIKKIFFDYLMSY